MASTSSMASTTKVAVLADRMDLPTLTITDEMERLSMGQDRISKEEMIEKLACVENSGLDRMTMTQHLYVIYTIVSRCVVESVNELTLGYISNVLKTKIYCGCFMQMLYDMLLADTVGPNPDPVWVDFKKAFLKEYMDTFLIFEAADMLPEGVEYDQLPLYHMPERFTRFTFHHLLTQNPTTVKVFADMSSERDKDMFAAIVMGWMENEEWVNCNEYDHYYTVLLIMRMGMVNLAFKYINALIPKHRLAVYRYFLNILDCTKRATWTTIEFNNWRRLRELVWEKHHDISGRYLPEVSVEDFNMSGCRYPAEHPLIKGVCFPGVVDEAEYKSMLDNLLDPKYSLTVYDHLHVIWTIMYYHGSAGPDRAMYYLKKCPASVLNILLDRYSNAIDSITGSEDDEDDYEYYSVKLWKQLSDKVRTEFEC